MEFMLAARSETILSGLYKLSGAVRFEITEAQFTAWLVELADAQLGTGAARSARHGFWRLLHVADLVLARACALGQEEAWQELIASYRAPIVRAAWHLCSNELRARELAESLWSDLYCARSKLVSYSGRGTLENWLKANIYQSNVNLLRTERRCVSLEERLYPICGPSVPCDLAETEASVLAAESLRSALRQLSAEDRLLLAAYYLDEKNLLQISAVLRVHESTVSRRLKRLVRGLERQVRQQLRARGLREPVAAPFDICLDLRRELS